MYEEIDIPLTDEEKKEKLELLKNFKFKKKNIHPVFFRYKYNKHGISINTIKKIFYNFDNIIGAFQRPGNSGYKYSFIYKINERKSMYICFFLDENPPKFFNAYYDYSENIERRIQRKIIKWMFNETKRE